MKAVPPSPELLSASTEDRVKQLKKRLESYLRDQSVDAVHDARTALRRLESAHSALPKKARKEKRLRDYIQLCREFFRANTPPRDCDILRAKLVEECGFPETDSLVITLSKKRHATLREARKHGKKLRDAKHPGVDPDDLDKDKLRGRYQGLLLKLTAQLGREVPVVLSDAARVKELHEVRKQVKKLRYALELSANQKALSGALRELGELQDLLGGIRDNDLAVKYLSGAGASVRAVRARNELTSKRDEAYRKLVTDYGERILSLVADL